MNSILSDDELPAIVARMPLRLNRFDPVSERPSRDALFDRHVSDRLVKPDRRVAYQTLELYVSFQEEVFVLFEIPNFSLHQSVTRFNLREILFVLLDLLVQVIDVGLDAGLLDRLLGYDAPMLFFHTPLI